MFNIQTVSKAAAGAIATAVVTYLSQRGFVVDQGFTGALAIVIAGVIGFGMVYLAPKNKE